MSRVKPQAPSRPGPVEAEHTRSPLSPVDRTASQSAAQAATMRGGRRRRREQQRLGDQQTQQLRARGTRADRTANRRAGHRAGEEQICQVGAGDEQHEPERPTSIGTSPGHRRRYCKRDGAPGASALASGNAVARRARKLAMTRSLSTCEIVPERRPISWSGMVRRSADVWVSRPRRNASTHPRWRQSLKVAGRTPTISCGSPSTRTVRPMMPASPPKRFFQQRWLMMSTRSLPWILRPAANADEWGVVQGREEVGGDADPVPYPPAGMVPRGSCHRPCRRLWFRRRAARAANRGSRRRNIAFGILRIDSRCSQLRVADE